MKFLIQGFAKEAFKDSCEKNCTHYNPPETTSELIRVATYKN